MVAVNSSISRPERFDRIFLECACDYPAECGVPRRIHVDQEEPPLVEAPGPWGRRA
jgi:hypothetical protein